MNSRYALPLDSSRRVVAHFRLMPSLTINCIGGCTFDYTATGRRPLGIYDLPERPTREEHVATFSNPPNPQPQAFFYAFSGTQLTLTGVDPNAVSIGEFKNWEGDCKGGRTCGFTFPAKSSKSATTGISEYYFCEGPSFPEGSGYRNDAGLTGEGSGVPQRKDPNTGIVWRDPEGVGCTAF